MAQPVEAFLRAFRKATRDYHDAFTGPGEKRANGPTAPAVLSILGKYLNQTPEQVSSGIQFVDKHARLNVADIAHQIDWYRSLSAIKVWRDSCATLLIEGHRARARTVVLFND